MAVPAKLREQLERWCVESTPEEHRHQMRNEVRFRGNTAVISEWRPPYRDEEGGWTDLAVARLRFDPDMLRWDLSWMRGTGRWEPYPEWRPALLARCLAEIDADPYCVFWG